LKEEHAVTYRMRQRRNPSDDTAKTSVFCQRDSERLQRRGWPRAVARSGGCARRLHAERGLLSQDGLQPQ
jgi:hypothetical protein